MKILLSSHESPNLKKRTIETDKTGKNKDNKKSILPRYDLRNRVEVESNREKGKSNEERISFFLDYSQLYDIYIYKTQF